MAYSPAGGGTVPRLRRCEHPHPKGWYCTRMGREHRGPCALVPKFWMKVKSFVMYGEWY